MKVGDLVRISGREPEFFGVPKGTLGLIIDIAVAESGIKYPMIQMCGIETPRRWLEQDLEVLHESR